ncbi:hypothetical protein HMN09_00310200 [Mycena chlorophos]|uniref:Uncharacterized protein n=1 Tax=Mycena chlorophos TaxID=658473 RepID=A0A8H6WGP2_MYCCL|nr:hypothetical protein HMN09_00310200 [Mycena chlorophos]
MSWLKRMSQPMLADDALPAVSGATVAWKSLDVDADDLAHRTAEELRDESEDDHEGSDSDEEQDREQAFAGHNDERVEAAGRFDSAAICQKRKHADLDYDGLEDEDLQGCADDLVPSSTSPNQTQKQARRGEGRIGQQNQAILRKRTAEANRTRVELRPRLGAAREPIASTGYVCLSDPTLNGRRENAAKAATANQAREGQPQNIQNSVFLPTNGKPTKEELEAKGMKELEWDGWLTRFSGLSQIVFIDRKGRELAVLCGQPRDTTKSNWKRDVTEAGFKLMQEASPKLSPVDGDAVEGGDDAAVLDSLLASKPFTRLAGFTNSIFLNFAPRLHEYYEATMDALFNWDSRLRRIFPHGTSVFPSCTFNFGPQTVTIPHLDLLNLAWGWCFITALAISTPRKAAI